MIGHVVGGFNHSKLFFTGADFIYDWIYSFHMPLMFVIAGYAHGMKEHYSSGQTYLYYLRKYIIDLYLPCIFFSFMLFLPKLIMMFISAYNAEGFTTVKAEDFFVIPFRGFKIFWFMMTLFFVKMLHLLLERYVKRKRLHFIFWLLVFICVHLPGSIIPSFFHQFRYGLYFHIGFMMKRHELLPAKISYGIALFLAGMGCFCASQFYGVSNVFIRIGASMCTSLASFIIFYALDIRNRLLVACGVYSMVIYCLHTYVISYSRVIYRFTGLSSSANIFILFIVSSASAVIIPLIIVWVYKNVKCLRWIEYIFYPGKVFLRK